MSPVAAKIIWVVGCIAWYLIRYPHERRARRTPVVHRGERLRERVLLVISLSGLGLVPFAYVLTGQPAFGDYGFHPLLAWMGAATFAAALYLFYRTHRDLGRAWSVTLEIRERHALVTSGVYRHVRHPMYSAFWLWAVAQALLLPNWIAGFAGLVGFGTLFFCRVGREEKMMLSTFGEEYQAYMRSTRRVIPRVY
jgi:protein-S-isoprenylcysteine O-methyltransferase Ste14